MTRTLRLKDLESAAANASEQPFFTTGSSGRNGVRGGFTQPPTSGDQLPFFEDFNSQPDWTSGMHSTDRRQMSGTHILPDGWYAARQDPEYSPSMGYPDGHESIEILAGNEDKTRTGTGKSYVSWRDSRPEPAYRWNSESILTKYFNPGYSQIYVEFWITFSDQWTWEGSQTSKIFRISSWDEKEDREIYSAFSGGNNGPIMLWNAQQSSYGVRNYMGLRGGPWGDNYRMNAERMPNLRTSMGHSGSINMNYTGHSLGLGRTLTDETPSIVDRVNGGFISDDLSQTVSAQQLFGGQNHWTKVAFFLKMNTHPDVMDGQLTQWIDDERVFHHDEIQWVMPSSQLGDPIIMPKWNTVSLGGNDYFKVYPPEDAVQEWYAFDDILMQEHIPEHLL